MKRDKKHESNGASSNYRTEGIDILLERDCILERYYGLIPYKKKLIESLIGRGYLTKNDCALASNETLIASGLPDSAAVGMFRAFLSLYDHRGKGARDIVDPECKSPEEIAAMIVLMRLPGVKSVRAELYCRCGITSLADLAESNADELREKIVGLIAEKGLRCSPPQPKELRTQIAVARVFTEYSC